MALRAPISLRIRDGFTDRQVGRYASSLRFRKSANGGHADASVTLNTPANMFTDLGPNDRLWVYDKRTGRCLFDGYTNNPGAQTGRTGEGFDLSALGGSSRAMERAERLVYIDQATDSWSADQNFPQTASAQAGPGQFPADAGIVANQNGIFCQFTPGQPVTTGSQAGAMYTLFAGSAMTMGGIVGIDTFGLTDANYSGQWVAMPNTGGPAPSVGASTTATNFAYYADGTGLPTGRTGIVFRFRRIAGGATNIASGNDNVWACIGPPIVFGHLKDRYGALRTMNSTLVHLTPASGSTPTTAYLLASDVVEDLLGRVLTFCDPAASVVDATTNPIDQLVYSDAATAGQVLDDLLESEGNMLWEVLETTPAGRHRFRWRAWPTTPRYQIPASMPVERPGGDVDLCNRIAVSWTDAKGNPQVTVRGAYVPALGDRSPILSDGTVDPAFVAAGGRIRDADPITLPNGKGSLANAQRIGDQVLAAKATPPRSATVRVDRPILDRDRGEKVQPWEIDPGYLVEVCATGELLRLTEMEYDDAEGVTTLTLGTPVLTVEQRIAELWAARS